VSAPPGSVIQSPELMTTSRQTLAIQGGPPSVRGKLDRAWPEILDEDRAAVLRVLDRGVLSGATAPENTALEREYADWLGVRHCLSLNSGTAALHCCAAAIGLEPGDEVIVPAFTFMATAMAMLNHGAVPVFCDVEPERFNLDPALIEERITPRTRAVLPVHLHGMPADLDEILGIADRHGLAVIEDTAQAHGARYKGRNVGTYGVCAGTSLQETKNLSGGEGGLFVTDDDDAYLAASRLRIFGEDVFEAAFGRYYWSHGIGWNYRNHELSAAFARSQLARVDGYIAAARANARRLSEALAGVPGIVPPRQPDDRESVWYAYRVRIDPERIGYTGPLVELRDRVLRALSAEGVPVMIWQDFPLSAHPVHRRPPRAWHPSTEAPLESWDREEFPVAMRIAEGSFLVGSHRTPLAIQRPDVLDAYAGAVAKVMSQIEALLAHPFEPIVRRPLAEIA
jgi:perosamine synthetase